MTLQEEVGGTLEPDYSCHLAALSPGLPGRWLSEPLPPCSCFAVRPVAFRVYSLLTGLHSCSRTKPHIHIPPFWLPERLAASTSQGLIHLLGTLNELKRQGCPIDVTEMPTAQQYSCDFPQGPSSSSRQLQGGGPTLLPSEQSRDLFVTLLRGAPLLHHSSHAVSGF